MGLWVEKNGRGSLIKTVDWADPLICKRKKLRKDSNQEGKIPWLSLKYEKIGTDPIAYLRI